MVAAFRAEETARPNALFRDPFAGRLAGERGRRIVAASGNVFLRGWTVVVRTAVIDEMLASSIDDGVDTVINLGAGLDTRPYRMQLPKTLRWVEIDQASVIDWKEEQLRGETPRCKLERVKLDLTLPQARSELFADLTAGSKHTLVLAEAIVPYLSTDEAGSLVRDLRAQSAIRSFIVDYFSPEVMRYRERSGMSRFMRNAPFRFAPNDWVTFFSKHGWSLRTMRYLPEEAQRLGRPFPVHPFLKIFLMLRGLIAGRARREAFRRFSGYALLEPAS